MGEQNAKTGPGSTVRQQVSLQTCLAGEAGQQGASRKPGQHRWAAGSSPTWTEQAEHVRRGVSRLGLRVRQRRSHGRRMHRHLLLQRSGVRSTQRRMDVQQRIPELLILQSGRLMLQGRQADKPRLSS